MSNDHVNSTAMRALMTVQYTTGV